MNSKPTRPPFEALLAVATVSFAILAAEVALTRSFSVLFRAPYVFLIVSGAIGGLGLGGLFVQFVRPGAERVRAWIVGLSVVLALAIAAPVLWLFASAWGREQVAHAELFLVLLIPMATFSLAGMLLSLIFREYAASGGLLYFVDLAAAALAAPASVWLLDRLGGINTPLLLAALTAAAALWIAVKGRRTGWITGAALGLLATSALFVSNVAQPWISLPTLRMPEAAFLDPEHPWHRSTKPLFAELASSSTSKVVRTDWTAVSRTDVVQEQGSDFYYVYTDGDVPTQMDRWDGSFETARREYATFIGSFPYRLMEDKPRRVLAIGAGGGLDVLLAKAYGAETVDAVEINPSIPAVVADPRFQSTYARVYREPGVRLVVDEGRSFLQRAGAYDLIYFACAKTATTQTGGVALLDNHLYTVEAFQSYWRHLAPRGMVALVAQEPFVIDRLLLTAVEALRTEGVQDWAPHLLTASVQPNRMGEGPYRYILLLRKDAWGPADRLTIQRAAGATLLQPIFVPHARFEGAGGGKLSPTAGPVEVRAVLEGQYQVPTGPGGATENANLGAVTDDSPFYVDIARGINPTVSGLVSGSLVAVVVVVLVVLALGVWTLRRHNPGEAAPAGPGALGGAVVYFAMLGAGFMLVELALMQRFILLLGFPTRALSVCLFSLLISSALGAAFVQRGTAADSLRRLRLLLPALVVLLVVYRLVLGPVLELFLPYPLPVRVAVTALLMFPAGFLMGMPFPTALRTLGGGLEKLIPAFWSVNGVTSIAGSVLTMVIAKFAGYGTALLVGAGCYAVAWIVSGVVGGAVRRYSSTEMTVSPT